MFSKVRRSFFSSANFCLKLELKGMAGNGIAGVQKTKVRNPAVKFPANFERRH